MGRHIPRQGNAGVFRGSGHGIVHRTHEFLQVKGFLQGRRGDIGQRAGGIAQDAQHLPCGSRHVLRRLAHGRRQGELLQGRAFPHEIIQRTAQGLFQLPGIRQGRPAFRVRGRRGGIRLRLNRRFLHVGQGNARLLRGQQAQIGIIKNGQHPGRRLPRHAERRIVRQQRTLLDGGHGQIDGSLLLIILLLLLTRNSRGRNDQRAQRRAPKRQRGKNAGGMVGIQTKHRRGRRQRRQEKPQQKAACARQSHEAGPRGRGHQQQRADRPERQKARHPAHARQHGQERQHRAGQHQQDELHIEDAVSPARAHEMPSHMGQKHERQSRRQQRGRVLQRKMPRPVARNAAVALHQSRRHIEGCPDAPLTMLGQTTQQTEQHDHPQGQQRALGGQTGKIGGRVVRRAQCGRKPQAGQTVQPQEADLAFRSGLGQQQDIAGRGRGFLPFHGAAVGIEQRAEQHRQARHALTHIQQDGAVVVAGRGGLQHKTQPGHTRHMRQMADIQRRKAALGQGGHLLHIHLARGVDVHAQIRQQGKLGNRQT